MCPSQLFCGEEAINANWAWSLLLLGQQVTEIDWGLERSSIALKQPNQFDLRPATHAWSSIVEKIFAIKSRKLQVDVPGGLEQHDVSNAAALQCRILVRCVTPCSTHLSQHQHLGRCVHHDHVNLAYFSEYNGKLKLGPPCMQFKLM